MNSVENREIAPLSESCKEILLNAFELNKYSARECGVQLSYVSQKIKKDLLVCVRVNASPYIVDISEDVLCNNVKDSQYFEHEVRRACVRVLHKYRVAKASGNFLRT